MNILVIDDDREKYQSIFEVFEKDPVNLYYYIEAPVDPGEAYLADLMGAVKEESISAIFSLTYYQFISLACGVLQIPYLCWMVKGYEKSSFDGTVRNPWNYIFSADFDTFDILENTGVQHVKYLPLSYEADDSVRKIPSKDILFVTDDVEDISGAGLSFDLLKDSSKGYLDGMLNSQKVDLRDRPLFDNAAVYFREDLKECYPLPKDNLESEGHRYDYRILFPVLNNKASHIMLFHITASWVKEDYKVDVLTTKGVSAKINHDRITYYSSDSDIGESIDFSDYKIIIYLPQYWEKNIITEEMLGIMASNSLLVLPGYVHGRVLHDTQAVFFKNRYELAKLVNKYLFDENARANELKKSNSYVLSVPAYKELLDTILSVVEKS